MGVFGCEGAEQRMRLKCECRRQLPRSQLNRQLNTPKPLMRRDGARLTCVGALVSACEAALSSHTLKIKSLSAVFSKEVRLCWAALLPSISGLHMKDSAFAVIEYFLVQ